MDHVVEPMVLRRYPKRGVLTRHKGWLIDVSFDLEGWDMSAGHPPKLRIKEVEKGEIGDYDEALAQATRVLYALIDSPEELPPALWEGEGEPPDHDRPERPEKPPERPPTKPPGGARAYPLSMTMGEYERDWKPEGWKLIMIGPTATWRQEWGMWEAIRDIVQNALDETESYQYGYDESGLWIADSGKGVGVADFLLGPPKLKDEWARGKFGEGMKIAALALVRAGIPVVIQTVGREVRVLFIEQEINGHVQSLGAIWHEDGTAIGTIFRLIGYTETAYASRFTINLPDNAILFRALSTISRPVQQYNLLIDPTKTNGPSIFARDIWMRSINSKWSYNLWGFDMSPDRHGPKNEYQLWENVSQIWAQVDDVALMEEFLGVMRESMDDHYDEYKNLSMNQHYLDYIRHHGDHSLFDTFKQNAGLWREAWANAFGQNAVLGTNAMLNGLTRHLGYEPVGLVYSITDIFGGVIKTDMSLLEESQVRLSEAEIIPDEQLEPKQRSILRACRILAKLLTSGVRGVYAAHLPAASDMVTTSGLYSKSTQGIYLSMGSLASGRSGFHTLIHEVAHHTSGADDADPRHLEAISELGVEAIYRAVRGDLRDAFDDDFSWW
ncbi:MAG: hypothetical protein ABIF09_17410 [Gemmatimonadota bacterium]